MTKLKIKGETMKPKTDKSLRDEFEPKCSKCGAEYPYKYEQEINELEAKIKELERTIMRMGKSIEKYRNSKEALPIIDLGAWDLHNCRMENRKLKADNERLRKAQDKPRRTVNNSHIGMNMMQNCSSGTVKPTDKCPNCGTKLTIKYRNATCKKCKGKYSWNSFMGWISPLGILRKEKQ